ncbi:MAG: hypothetical protein ACHQQQ_03320 [Bacteroidota bacterium]
MCDEHIKEPPTKKDRICGLFKDGSFKFPSGYEEWEIDKIITAYRDVFNVYDPESGEVLKKYYWENTKFEGNNQWELLTSDFTVERNDFKKNLLQFDKSYREFLKNNSKIFSTLCPKKIGEKLLELFPTNSSTSKIGFSIGICPKTDDLLLESYKPHEPEREIIIVLGHNWYPIVTKNKELPFPPLTGESVFECTRNYKKYGRYFDQRLLDKFVVLYLNLYPHFLPPGDPTTGAVSAPVLEKYLCHFENLCRIIQKRRNIQGIITWGAPVYEQIRTLFIPEIKSKYMIKGVTKAATESRVKIDQFLLAKIGGEILKVYPHVHPCHQGNFRTKEHRNSYCKTINAILELAC